MRTALVLGITGGFGRAVARALVTNDWQIKALVRDPKRLPPEFSNVEVARGDVSNVDHIRQAAAGVDLLVYGVNPAKYRWRGVALPLLENTAQIAEELGLTIVFPGNVYNLDPLAGPEFSESSVHRAVNGKGQIREAMERRLVEASSRGAHVILLRLGDFIGSDLSSAWLGQLISRTKTGYVLKTPGPSDLVHTWAYLPDVGATVAQLVDLPHQLAPYSEFHFRGHQLSFKDIAAAMRQASGLPVTIKTFPWWAVRILSPLSGLFRSLLEMRYLWCSEINLNQNKLCETLGGKVPHTPISEALLNSDLVRLRTEISLDTVTS
ncbi:MAG: NAD(P)H-binding protein [Proteobacteria bacterium]|nr:NAD(P)H-binding protein [Pseudomonadota bacterium]